jgi:hypothetical protein
MVLTYLAARYDFAARCMGMFVPQAVWALIAFTISLPGIGLTFASTLVASVVNASWAIVFGVAYACLSDDVKRQFVCNFEHSNDAERHDREDDGVGAGIQYATRLFPLFVVVSLSIPIVVEFVARITESPQTPVTSPPAQPSPHQLCQPPPRTPHGQPHPSSTSPSIPPISHLVPVFTPPTDDDAAPR